MRNWDNMELVWAALFHNMPLGTHRQGLALLRQTDYDEINNYLKGHKVLKRHKRS